MTEIYYITKIGSDGIRRLYVTERKTEVLRERQAKKSDVVKYLKTLSDHRANADTVLTDHYKDDYAKS